MVELEKLRIQVNSPVTTDGQTQNTDTKAGHKKKHDGRFLKGPVPLDWLLCASKLKGRSLSVGLYLWYLSGLKKNNCVKLSNVYVKRDLDISHDTKSRALKELKKAGLITLTQKPGQSPLVCILKNIGKNKIDGSRAGEI